jgi:two-component system LytT family response regulator
MPLPRFEGSGRGGPLSPSFDRERDVKSTGGEPSTKYKVVIVDDEPSARVVLRDCLATEADIEIVAECANGEEAVEAITRERPDIVLLDLQMPRIGGFEALKRLQVPVPIVIFITASDRHAVEAFEVEGCDYLVKPFKAERFRLALQRARAALSNGQPANPERGQTDSTTAKKTWLTRLSVRQNAIVSFVNTKEIDWIEADGNYCILHSGKKRHMIRELIGALEGELNPSEFQRVSRSAIVRLDRVRQIDTSSIGNYSLVLIDGTQVRTSRNLGELSALLRSC